MNPILSVMILLLVTGCATVKRDHQMMTDMAKIDATIKQYSDEVRQLKEELELEQGFEESERRDLNTLHGKVKRYLALNCLCVHKGVLK